MADGTENEKETKNIESSASAAQDAESNATERFRQDLHDSLSGSGNKGKIQESMDKMPMHSSDKARQEMDKLPIASGNKGEQMDKLPISGGAKEQMDKLPAGDAKKPEQMDKLPSDKKPADNNKTGKEEMDKLPSDEAKDKLDKNKDGKLDDLEKKIEEELPEQEELPTGDVIKRDENGETLVTPNGDEISVNADGSHSIKGDVKSVESKDGVTTVTLGDGSQVSFDEEGILSVQRGNQAVAFSRQNYGYGGKGGGGGSPGGFGGGGGFGDIPSMPKPIIKELLPNIKLR